MMFKLYRRGSREIPQEHYDRSYLLSDYLEGYQEYTQKGLSVVKAKQLGMLNIKQGASLLDVGYGRGELLLHCAQQGARVSGIDFSRDAFDIVKQTLKDYPGVDVRMADCRQLPFEADSFDRVFSGDVVEHLCFTDAILMLKEMYRVLKPGGLMLVHTTPNTVFTKGVYPLARPFLKWIHKETVQVIDQQLLKAKEVHVDEHNLWTLRYVARRAGIKHAQVWIDSDLLRSPKNRYTQNLRKNPVISFLGRCGHLSGIRFFLGNDLYLKCFKIRAEEIDPITSNGRT